MSTTAATAARAAAALHDLRDALAELGRLDIPTMNDPNRTASDAIADLEQATKDALFDAATEGR